MSIGTRICCCVQPAVTLWKIDLSDGSVVWTADRGATSNALRVVDEGGTTYIYECGSYIDSTEKSVTKWKDNGSTVTKEWTTTKGTESAFDVMTATDGTVWMWGGTNIVRFNTSGVEQHSVARPFFTGTGGWLTAIAGGSMGAWHPNLTATYHIYDNTATSTNTHANTSSENFRPIGDRIDTVSGWVWTDQVATNLRPVHLNATFTEQDRNTAAGEQSQVFMANANYIWGWLGTSSRISAYDYSSGLPEQWNDTDVASAPGANMASSFDGSDNLYAVIEESSTNIEYVKKWNSSGTIQWETLSGGSTSAITHHDSTNSQVIVISFSGTITVGSNTDVVHALDDSDGSTNWSVSSTIQGGMLEKKHSQIFGGHLYLCGTRYVPP